MGIKNRFTRLIEKADVHNSYFVATVVLSSVATVCLIFSIIVAVILAFQGNKISELNEELSIVNDEATNLRREARKNSNPVIRSPGLENASIYYNSAHLDNDKQVRLWIRDGRIENCMVHTLNTPVPDTDCEVEGISGSEEIYKAVNVNFGFDDDALGIGLITKLGSLYYIKLTDLINSGRATISSKITFENPVVDILEAIGSDASPLAPMLIFSNNDYRVLKREEVGL